MSQSPCNAKHTPGPWIARQFISGHWEVCEDDTSNRIAGVDGRDDGANARLIAAAPELLSTLKAVLTLCESRGKAFGHASRSQTESEAWALIAKAEGSEVPRD